MLNMAYFAGFFDADGSLGVYRDSHQPKNRPPMLERYGLRTNVTNQNKQLLLGFKALWGGGVYRQLRGWCWMISSWKAYYFLSDILPHIVHKRDQIELALEFQETKNRITHRARRSDPSYGKSVSDRLKQMKRKHRELLTNYQPYVKD